MLIPSLIVLFFYYYVTNYHGLSDLTQHKFITSQFYGSGIQHRLVSYKAEVKVSAR